MSLLLGEGSRFETELLLLSSLLLCEYASFLLQVLLSLGVVGIKLFPSWVLLVLLHLVVEGRADRVDLRMELFTELVLSMPESLWCLAGRG